MSVDQATLRLQAAREKVEQAKTARTRAEARMEELKRQAEQVKGECAALGVTPDTLEEEIAKLTALRDSRLAEAEALLQGA